MNKPFLLSSAAILMAALPVSAASGCAGVFAASLKVFQVPAHLHMTRTADFNKGKTENSESICLNGTIFVMVRGVVRDELVGGEPATLFKVHSEDPDDKVDTQIWISKLRGLPLRQISDNDVGGAGGKSHTEIRFEYTNVTAPEVTASGGK